MSTPERFKETNMDTVSVGILTGTYIYQTQPYLFRDKCLT